MQQLQTADRQRAGPVVSDAEIKAFRRDGFVLPKVGLPPADTAELQVACEAVFRDNEDWENLLRMPHVPKRAGQLEGVIGGEALFPFAIHPTVIEAARRLIGPNLILWGGEIFAKPPGVGKPTPWHQDCYNPAIKPRPGGEFARSVMIWIAIDPCDPENGCLRFIPRSGRNGPRTHDQHEKTDALLNFEADKRGLDVDGAVDAILAPGHFSGHDLFVVHGAEPNNSKRRRGGITFHYMDAADLYDRSFGAARGSGGDRKPAPLADRPIWLVLGENQNSGNDFKTGHQNIEDLDVLAEKQRLKLNAELLG